MTISELRYGKEDDNGIPVEFVNDIPKDKIIIALNPKLCRAYLINEYDEDTINMVRISKGVFSDNKIPKKMFFKERELKIYQLHHLGEFKDLPNIGYYD